MTDERGDRSGETAFEASVLPHLDAAYTLARYLLRDQTDAEDAVQDAVLRALKYFRRSEVADPKAWLLAIVRNTCYTLRGRWTARANVEEYDDVLHTPAGDDESGGPDLPPGVTVEGIRNAIGDLPVEYREVVILREVQGCSYQEIARIANIPVGTVMSRLSRARERLRRALASAAATGGSTERTRVGEEGGR